MYTQEAYIEYRLSWFWFEFDFDLCKIYLTWITQGMLPFQKVISTNPKNEIEKKYLYPRKNCVLTYKAVTPYCNQLELNLSVLII